MAEKMSLDGFKPIVNLQKRERRARLPKILPCANCGSTKFSFCFTEQILYALITGGAVIVDERE